MDAATRNRIEAIGRSLNRRVLAPLSAWQNMLHALIETAPDPGRRPDHDPVPAGGQRGRRPRDRCRPASPLARSHHSVRGHAGARRRRVCWSPRPRCVTRAMPIRNPPGSRPRHASARRICRLRRSVPPSRARSTTPRRHAPSSSPTSTAATSPSSRRPIARLFLAAGGGALGLFTAIRRLAGRACAHRARTGGGRHPALRPARRCDGQRHSGRHLPHRGGELPAGHRRDAGRRRRAGSRTTSGGVREGPLGRVPTFCIANGASISRRAIRRRIDDRIARLRLRQAFGRLIRRASDRGVFVLLDRQTPSRLLSAFPAGVTIRRVGLAEAVKQTCAFLGESLPA